MLFSFISFYLLARSPVLRFWNYAPFCPILRFIKILHLARSPNLFYPLNKDLRKPLILNLFKSQFKWNFITKFFKKKVELPPINHCVVYLYTKRKIGKFILIIKKNTFIVQILFQKIKKVFRNLREKQLWWWNPF